MSSLQKELDDYKKEMIKRIMAIPASLAPDFAYDFTIRGATLKEIKWNEKMLKDPGVSIDTLRPIMTILENKYFKNNT